MRVRLKKAYSLNSDLVFLLSREVFFFWGGGGSLGLIYRLEMSVGFHFGSLRNCIFFPFHSGSRSYNTHTVCRSLLHTVLYIHALLVKYDDIIRPRSKLQYVSVCLDDLHSKGTVLVYGQAFVAKIYSLSFYHKYTRKRLGSDFYPPPIGRGDIVFGVDCPASVRPHFFFLSGLVRNISPIPLSMDFIIIGTVVLHYEQICRFKHVFR